MSDRTSDVTISIYHSFCSAWAMTRVKTVAPS